MEPLLKLIRLIFPPTLYLWAELFSWPRVMVSLSFIADDISLLVKSRKGTEEPYLAVHPRNKLILRL